MAKKMYDQFTWATDRSQFAWPPLSILNYPTLGLPLIAVIGTIAAAPVSRCLYANSYLNPDVRYATKLYIIVEHNSCHKPIGLPCPSQDLL